MLIEISPRQGGKTTRMLDRLRKDERTILLTYSIAEARRLEEIAAEWEPEELVRGLIPSRRRILYWNHYKSYAYTPYSWVRDVDKKHRAHQLLIDNADMVLVSMFGWVDEINLSSTGDDREVVYNPGDNLRKS